MTATDTTAAQPRSEANDMEALTRELAAADAKLKSAAGERVAALRTARDDLRRHLIDATSREIARLDSDRVIAEHAATVARGSARAQTEARVKEVQRALAQRHDELAAQISQMTREADDQITTLKAHAVAATGATRARLEALADRLKAGRDALAAKGQAFRQAGAAQWQKAKSELDASMLELSTLYEQGELGVN
jgi:CRISPR/Cas system Type II protein with McrA/HNH and RuvC-like nuclease domain